MAYITLNKNHFFNNLDIIAKITKSIDKIALVLKDNAYGHGILEVATMAKEYGITHAVVQHHHEALVVEDFFEYILVLADIPKKSSQQIRYAINDIESIKLFPKDTLVELKVNSGMNRNGIEMDELQSALELIEVHGLKLEAIFTHHGSADEQNGLYEEQKASFKKIKKRAPKNIHFHSCNSAALFRESDFNEDMARVGIAAYGCLDLPFVASSKSLKPILSLYAKKISSRVVKKGSFVGYGASYEALKDTFVSNYDFGYGDGFLRTCSNSYTTPKKIKIAGRISMDNSSFLSDRDELLIFNDAKEVSRFAKTISYEVLTSLKSTIPRTIMN